MDRIPRIPLRHIPTILLIIAVAGSCSLWLTDHYQNRHKRQAILDIPKYKTNQCGVHPLTVPTTINSALWPAQSKVRTPTMSQHFMRWHPEGNSIFFDYDTHPFTEQAIWQVNTHGTNLRKAAEPKQFEGKIRDGMTAYLGSKYGFDADLSPNGDAIVYSTCTDDKKNLEYPKNSKPGRYDLAISRMNGSKPNVITKDIPELAMKAKDVQIHPAWSPDGTKIAFVHANSSPHDYYFYEPHIQIIQIDHTYKPTDEQPYPTGWPLHRTTLTAPIWSPDSQKIAFIPKHYRELTQDIIRVLELQTDEPNQMKVTKIMVDKKTLERLNETYRTAITTPVWSADSSQIAYATVGRGGYDPPPTVAIHITTVFNQETNTILLGENSHWPAPFTQLAWHPEGTELLLMNKSLTSIRIEDQTETTLLKPEFFEEGERPMAVAWSPDGTQIALKTENQCGIKLLLMTRKGENVRTIAELKRPPIPGKETQKDPCTRSNPHAH